MPSNRTCSKCGFEVPENELQGLCPNCVGRVAFLVENDADQAGTSADGLRHFGDYELVEEIARGGMGVVHKARQLSLNRLVAVKMILAGRLASDAAVLRFRAEAEAAGNLQHPNIVAIHEVGQHQGEHYFSMDYVEGRNLAQILADRRGQGLEGRQAAGYLETIAEAIQFAHERGTLHRDLKPSNVIIDGSGQPRITDFGLAKRMDESDPSPDNPQLTVSGQILGTPAFMPPEQAAGNHAAVSAASDVYSLGAILYFLLTGQPPFAADTALATLRQVIDQEPVPPNLALRRQHSTPDCQNPTPRIDKDLETICLKCLEKVPQRRYATAKELAEDLGRFLRSEPILGRRVSRAEKLLRRCRRHPVTAVLSLVLLLFAGIWIQRALARRVIPNLPILVATGVSGVIDSRLYVAVALEGYSGMHNYLYVYDPDLNTWAKLRNTPFPPGNCAAGVIAGKFYLAGGYSWHSQETNSLSVFDPVSNLWTNKTPMPTARAGCTGVAFDGRLFVVGGAAGQEPMDRVEIYDPTKDTWSTGKSMPWPRTGASVAVSGQMLYVLGGNPGSVGHATNTMAAYDFVQETWTNCAPLPHLRSSPFMAANHGRLFVAGGASEQGDTAILEVYDPATNSWETRASMPARAYQGAGAQVINGRIWAIGGWTSATDKITGDAKVAHNEIFIYDPARDSWTTSGNNH